MNNKKGEKVEKQIYALYSHSLTLETAIIELKDMMEWLVTQIFIAHHQWNSHNQLLIKSWSRIIYDNWGFSNKHHITILWKSNIISILAKVTFVL